MPGRPKKPAAQRKLEGNRSRRPIPKEPNVEPLRLGICPEWFPPAARWIYDELGPRLRAEVKAGTIDEPALLAGSLAFGLGMQDGQKATKAKGQDRYRAQRMFRQQMELAMKIFAKFGMSPSDRTKLVADAQVVTDAVVTDDILDGEWRPTEQVQ